MTTPATMPSPDTTALAALKRLPAAARAEIASWQNEQVEGVPVSVAELRERVTARFQIELAHDDLLSSFWRWQEHQDRLRHYNEMLENFEEFFRLHHPEASAEKVREAGIAFFMAETLDRRDRKGFTELASLSLRRVTTKASTQTNKRRLELAEAKFKAALRTKLETGLDELAAAFQSHPAALNLYQQARALITRETK